MSDLIKHEFDKDGMDWYDHFSSGLGIHTVAGIPQREGWIRKGVIVNYHEKGTATPELARNFDNHVKAGFTIVFSQEKLRDDREHGPNANRRPNTLAAPIQGRTTEGYDYVVMEVEAAKFNAMKSQQAKDWYQSYLKSTGAQMIKTQEGYALNVREQESKF